MLKQALLRRLIVIGSNQQRAVRADRLGGLSQFDCLGSGISAGAGEHLDFALGCLHGELDHADVLVKF